VNWDAIRLWRFNLDNKLARSMFQETCRLGPYRYWADAIKGKLCRIISRQNCIGLPSKAAFFSWQLKDLAIHRGIMSDSRRVSANS
jgi:hypothetical protein